MWVTSSWPPRDTLRSDRSAGTKWWVFLNWLPQSQQSRNCRFFCEQWWTFLPTVPSTTLMYTRCNMEFLIQRALPSKLQWALLFFNSSSSRTVEIKEWEHKPCKDWFQNAGHSTDGAVWSLRPNGCPAGALPRTQKGGMLLPGQSLLLVTDLRRQTWVWTARSERAQSRNWGQEGLWGVGRPLHPQHLTVLGDSLQQGAPSMHWQQCQRARAELLCK